MLNNYLYDFLSHLFLQKYDYFNYATYMTIEKYE